MRSGGSRGNSASVLPRRSRKPVSPGRWWVGSSSGPPIRSRAPPSAASRPSPNAAGALRSDARCIWDGGRTNGSISSNRLTAINESHSALTKRSGVRSPAGRRASDDERPAHFSAVLAVGEFRTIYLAGVLSWIGDYAARAAVTALVLQATHSIVAAAAAFAITYAPWLLGGQVLVSLAERYPYRTVMITCDIARMVLMALVAVPGVPLPVVLTLLLASAAFSPPFDAA